MRNSSGRGFKSRLRHEYHAPGWSSQRWNILCRVVGNHMLNIFARRDADRLLHEPRRINRFTDLEVALLPLQGSPLHSVAPMVNACTTCLPDEDVATASCLPDSRPSRRMDCYSTEAGFDETDSLIFAFKVASECRHRSASKLFRQDP